MRLSHPSIIHSAALLVSGAFRLWMSTLALRVLLRDPAGESMGGGGGSLFLFWHEYLFLPAYTHAHRGVPVLVSQHRDGEFVSQVVRMLRGRTFRGSTTQGGAAALREMIRAGGVTDLAITPDGPRGPRREVQQGAVYLASRAGIAVVPVGCGVHRGRRFASWDRMMLPAPGSRAVFVVGAAMPMPPDLDREDLESQRQRVQRSMDDVQTQADDLAHRWRPGECSDNDLGLLTVEQAVQRLPRRGRG